MEKWDIYNTKNLIFPNNGNIKYAYNSESQLLADKLFSRLHAFLILFLNQFLFQHIPFFPLPLLSLLSNTHKHQPNPHPPYLKRLLFFSCIGAKSQSLQPFDDFRLTLTLTKSPLAQGRMGRVYSSKTSGPVMKKLQRQMSLVLIFVIETICGQMNKKIEPQ